MSNPKSPKKQHPHSKETHFFTQRASFCRSLSGDVHGRQRGALPADGGRSASNAETGGGALGRNTPFVVPKKLVDLVCKVGVCWFILVVGTKCSWLENMFNAFKISPMCLKLLVAKETTLQISCEREPEINNDYNEG